MRQAFERLPPAVADAPGEYAMLLTVCTDGMPDNKQFDYVSQVDALKQRIEEEHGPSAVPAPPR